MSPPLPGGEIFRCLECNLLFRSPILSGNSYNELYDNDEISTWTVDLRRDQEIVLSYIKQNVQSGSLLDFGCYTGNFLNGLPDSFEKYGIEINRKAAKIAEEQHGAKTWPDLQSIQGERVFDVVVAMDVIEHMLSPSQTLEELLSAIKPKGLLLLTTGDADSPLWKRSKGMWWYCRYPEHISFISKNWLTNQSRKLPFHVEHFENFNYIASEPVIKTLSRRALFKFGQLTYPMVSRLINLAGRRFPRGAHIAQAALLSGIGVSDDHIFVALRKK